MSDFPASFLRALPGRMLGIGGLAVAVVVSRLLSPGKEAPAPAPVPLTAEAQAGADARARPARIPLTEALKFEAMRDAQARSRRCWRISPARERISPTRTSLPIFRSR